MSSLPSIDGAAMATGALSSHDTSCCCWTER
jgi:hypothetical protein